MKKKNLFTALLALMLVCSVLICTGCQKDPAQTTVPSAEPTPSALTAAQVQQDPSAALLSAYTKTAQSVAKASPFAPLSGFLKKGKLTVSVPDMLKNELYYDLENKSYANLLTLTLDGQTIDLSLYDRAPEGAVSSNYLFGDAVYGLNLNNLSKTVPASAIWEMLGVSYNDVKSMIEPVLESLKNAAAFDITKLTEKLSQAIENNCTISAADGQADTVVITVSFNKEQLLAVSQKIIDTVKEFMTYLGSASGSINGAEFDKALKALGKAWPPLPMPLQK